MKKSQRVSVLGATVLCLASLPSHALFMDERTIPSNDSLLDIISAHPGATRANRYASNTLLGGFFTLDLANGWRQLYINENGRAGSVNNPQGRILYPEEKTSFADNGNVSTVPEPSVLLLLATGLVGLVWSARMKSAKHP